MTPTKKRRLHRIGQCGALLALSVCVASTCASRAIAGAITVPPGGISSVPADGGPTGSPLTLATLTTNPFVSNFGGSFDFAGTLVSTVVTNDSSNAYGPTALDFIYSFTNGAGSGMPIRTISLNGFNPLGELGPTVAAFNTDVSYETGAAALPINVSRQANGFNLSFDGFRLGGAGLAATDVLIVRTNATSYTTAQDSVQGAGVATMSAFAPAVVPEPSTLVLASFAALAFGVLGLRGLRNR